MFLLGHSSAKGFYGALYISGKPICVTFDLKVPVVCKQKNYVTLPFNANRFVDTTSFSQVSQIMYCKDPNYDNIKDCSLLPPYNCLAFVGVACLNSNSFELRNPTGILEAFDIPVIFTRRDQWSLTENKVLCLQKFGTEYGSFRLLSNGSNPTCLIRNVNCTGNEDGIEKCSYDLVTECPKIPFYQISVRCAVCSEKDLINIIRLVIFDVHDSQKQYNSIIHAISKLKSQCQDWNCSASGNTNYLPYCSTQKLLYRLKHLLQPTKQNKLIFLNVKFDHSVMLRETLLEERFTNLESKVSNLGMKITDFQLKLGKHFHRMASFEANRIKIDVDGVIIRQKQLEVIFKNKLDKLKSLLNRLRKYVLGVNIASFIEAGVELALLTTSTIWNIFELNYDPYTTAMNLKAIQAKILRLGADQEKMAYIARETQKLAVIFRNFESSWKKNNAKIKQTKIFLNQIMANKESFDEEAAAKFLDMYSSFEQYVIDPIDLAEVDTTLNYIVSTFCSIITDSESLSGIEISI